MIYQTMCFIEGGKGEIFACDTIIYKNEPWLVLSWLKTLAGEPKRPERIVRLGAFRHQVLAAGNPFGNYTINDGLPKSLFCGGQLPTDILDDVIDHPDISFLIGQA